jgi:hypothetical protein
MIGILIIPVLAGCGAFSSNAILEPEETVEAAATPEVGFAITDEAVDSTDDPATTPEITPEVTQEATANPAAFTDGDYLITATRLQPTEGVNVDPAPDGHRWLMLTANISNTSGPEVEVATEHIAIIDPSGNRYQPGAMVERVNPPLVGAVLPEGESVYGFAIFAVPDGVEPDSVEWCPGGACDAPLQTSVNFFDF